MRQRNDTGYAQHVMAWPTEDDPTRQPFVVGADEEIDFPELLGGFTFLGDNEEPIAEEPAPVAEEPVRKRKDAAVAADKEAGEPQ